MTLTGINAVDGDAKESRCCCICTQLLGFSVERRRTGNAFQQNLHKERQLVLRDCGNRQ